MSKKKLLTVLAGLASLCLGVNAAELNAYSVIPTGTCIPHDTSGCHGSYLRNSPGDRT